jgi:hypothetical protein
MRVLAILLALVVTLVGAESGQACSCVYVPPKKQLERADGAAVLRLVEVRPSRSDADELIYRVGRVVKGGPALRRGRRITVLDPTHQLCGPGRVVGRLTGLFMGRNEDGRWTASACSEISAAQMRRLGERVASSSATGGCAGSAAAT